MTAPTPYLTLSGHAREALEFYRGVFGGHVELNTFADFGRDDGEPEWVAHGILTGPVSLFVSDAGAGESTLDAHGLLFALLGTADAATSTEWFRKLAAGGEALDDLQERPWGDWDGKVRDGYGLTWLIGFTPGS